MAEDRKRQTISYTCPKGHNFKLRQVAGRGGYCPKCKLHVDGPITHQDIKEREQQLEEELATKHRRDHRVRKARKEREAEEGPKLEEGTVTKIGPGPDPEEPEPTKEEPKALEEKHAGIFF